VSEQVDPGAVYQERRAVWHERIVAFERRDGLIANLRLAVAVVALVIAYLAFGVGLFTAWWLGLAAAVFLGLAVFHEATLRRRDVARLAARFYERGLLRLADRWAGSGTTGERFLTAEHAYAADLDLFGAGSLFELLCTAHTAGGEEHLARLLSQPAAVDVVRARQEAVRDVAGRLELREELFVLAKDVRAGVHPAALGRWGEAPSRLGQRSLWPVASALVLLAVGGILALVGWGFLGVGPLPFLVLLVLDWVAARLVMRRLQGALDEVSGPSAELTVAARLMERVERESFASALLTGVLRTLTHQGRASSAVRRLSRLVELADARRNQLFAPLAYVLLWGPLFSLAIERWRTRHGGAIGGWLAALADLEALASLGAYAHERPDDVYPELVASPPTFVATGLTHPLLPAAQAVRNDVRLAAPLRLMLVSGSNMSGKSTLLRSVGVSVVMAMAGAPVRAKSLTLSPLALGATLRVTDSLQGGASRFYAEILRLKQIVELAAKGPVMFLLDEILHGTNSHDRKAGAAALVTTLVERGAIGLVTTHDLAIAEVCERLGARAENVHFADHLEGDRLVFDYTMRKGIVERSNATALMRAVGLPV
jgi:hypothetical protein